MTWTNKSPGGTGCYWLLAPGCKEPCLAVVRKTDDGLSVSTHHLTKTDSAGVILPLSERLGLWCGPIRPPELP